METDANRVVAEILRADDTFLIEVGRLTLLFSHIEDLLVQNVLWLLEIVDDTRAREEAVSNIPNLRVLEKRDYLRRLCSEIGRFYDVDYSRVGKVLDDLGNINRLRRTVVHGWIRWSQAEEMPIFTDSHGHSSVASSESVADLNIKVLNWVRQYCSEQAALMRSVLCAYDSFKLLRCPKISAMPDPTLY